jgi:hypothetical protein
MEKHWKPPCQAKKGQIVEKKHVYKGQNNAGKTRSNSLNLEI